MNLLDNIKETVVIGKVNRESEYPPDFKGSDGVQELVEEALEKDLDISDILNKGLIKGMDVVGNKFSAGEYYVPEMLLSAQAMKAGLNVLEPYLTAENSQNLGTVILGTVKGDMHDIGKNLVSIMLEGKGFEIIDLGTDTPPEKFAEVANQHPEAVIGMSALLTTTREMMRKTIAVLRDQGLQNKVIIGGAATSQTFADEIHADAFSRNAAKAGPMVMELMGISA